MAFQLASQLSSKAPAPTGSKLSPKGSPSERLWVIAEAPLPKDKDKGFLFSSPMGWSFDKLLGDSGLRNYYCTYFESSQEAVDTLNKFRPPMVICLDTALKNLAPNIKVKEEVGLWAGSLLTSDKLFYPHYLMPTFGPETCVSDWTERQIVKFIDLGKAKSELDFYLEHGVLQPLPQKQLDINLDIMSLINRLEGWTRNLDIEYLSVDIETIYPREKSDWFGHPGLPVTIGIAPSPSLGISFPLFQETTQLTAMLWKALGSLFWEKKIIGQNFFLFDYNFLKMLGIPPKLENVYDTMFRHAILWPELSHKLQFLTRQYTRQPYYKSEGKQWNIKQLDSLKRYNALDVVTTFDVFNAQEEEFAERPHLR